MAMTGWPEDDEAKMRDWWDKDFSCQQISDAFKGKYSRKAIAGKARRLNLASRPSTMNRGREHRHPVRVKPKPVLKPPEIAPPAQEPEFLGPIGDFPDSGCLYPRNAGDQIQFCGHEKKPGKPYCPWHCQISYSKPLTAKSSQQVNMSARASRVIR